MLEYTETFTVPEWAVSYLEYGDSSGLTPDEIAQIERFEARLNTYGPHGFEWGNDIGFCTNNDIGGLACNCIQLHLFVDVPRMAGDPTRNAWHLTDIDGFSVHSGGFESHELAERAAENLRRTNPYETIIITKGAK